VVERVRDPKCVPDEEFARLSAPKTNLPWEIGRLVGIAIDELRGSRSKRARQQYHFETKTVHSDSTRAAQAAALPRSPLKFIIIREEYDMVCRLIASLPENERAEIAVDQILRNDGAGMFKTLVDCSIYHERDKALKLLLTQLRTTGSARRSWHQRLHTLYRQLASMAGAQAARIATNPAVIAIVVLLWTAADAFASKVH
jgi:hypothetical protein